MDIFLFIASTTASLYFNKISKRKSPASYEVSKKHIITVGLLCLDIHAASVDSLPEGGGVHFIDKIHLSCAGTSGGTVITLAKLGLSTAIFGCMGKSDESGCYLLNKLKSLHVSTHGIQYSPTKPTSATVINVRSNGDRPCLHQLGASDDLDLSSSNLLQQVIASNPEIIHIGGLGLTPGCIQEKTLLMFLQSVATHFNLKPKIVSVAIFTSIIVVYTKYYNLFDRF